MAGASTGTNIVGYDRPPTSPRLELSCGLLEAELVRERTVVLAVSDNLESKHEQLQQNFLTFRKRIYLIIGIVIVLLVGVGVGVYFGVVQNRDQPPLLPTEAPVLPPLCSISMDIECFATNNAGISCDSIPEPKALCRGTPLGFGFTYSGSKCSDSSNLQGAPVFECIDAKDASPVVQGQQVFIVARDVASETIIADNLDAVLLRGNRVLINVSDFDVALGDTMNISIYSASDRTPESMLQTFVFQSSCSSSNLMLGDRFGSLQLVTLNTTEGLIEGESDRFVNVTYLFTTTNEGRDHVNLTSIRSESNTQIDFSRDALMLSPDDTHTFEETVEIDLGFQKRFDVFGFVSAASSEGPTCSTNAFFNFDAGIATPAPAVAAPSVSRAPSLRPSDSSAPSLRPPLDSCIVTLDVICHDNSTGLSCSDSAFGFSTSHVCIELPTSMSFRYMGGNCSQSFNTQNPQIFQCEDLDGGPPTDQGESSLIVATNVDNSVIHHAAVVRVGGIFTAGDIDGVFPSSMSITVYSSPGQNVLQTFVLDTSCMTGHTFLTDRYGSFHLVGFGNELQGNVTSFVDVTYSYVVTNPATESGSTNFDTSTVTLETLISISNGFGGFNPVVNLTEQVNGVVLSTNASLVIQVAVIVDLSVRTWYTFFSTVQGVSPRGATCSASHFHEFIAGRTFG